MEDCIQRKSKISEHANKDVCIFCKIIKGEIESKKVYEDDNFFGILDANPKAEGHTLIMPKQHFKTILDMPNSLGNEMLEAVKKVALDLIQQGKAEGFNLVVNTNKAGGQLVDHVHVHIIPRKEGDGLKMIA